MVNKFLRNPVDFDRLQHTSFYAKNFEEFDGTWPKIWTLLSLIYREIGDMLQTAHRDACSLPPPRSPRT